MPSAYESRPYDSSRATARMADLVARQGDVAANATMQRGQNSAMMWNNLGQIATGTMQELVRLGQDLPRQREEQRRLDEAAAARKKQEKIAAALKDSVDPTTKRLNFTKAAEAVGQVDPVEALQWWKGADAEKAEQLKRDGEKAEEVAKRLAIVLRASEKDQEAGPGALQTAPRVYADMRAKALKTGLVSPEDLPEEYDPAVVEQSMFEAMTATQVFSQLWKAKPAKVGTHVVDGALVDDSGRVLYKSDKPEQRSTKVVDGRLVDDQTGKVIYTSPDAGKGGTGAPTGPTPAQIQRARDMRFDRLQDLEQRRNDNILDPEQYADAVYRVEQEFATATGAPPPPPPLRAERPPAGAKGLAESGGSVPETMGDLLPAPGRNAARPTPPMGAAPVAAAPAGPPPEVKAALMEAGPGEYDLRDGSTWRVYRDGRMERVK